MLTTTGGNAKARSFALLKLARSIARAQREIRRHVVEAALMAATNRRERQVSVCEVRRFLWWETDRRLDDASIRRILSELGWTVDTAERRTVALAPLPR